MDANLTIEKINCQHDNPTAKGLQIALIGKLGVWCASN
jgi:hypothetical protein